MNLVHLVSCVPQGSCEPPARSAGASLGGENATRHPLVGREPNVSGLRLRREVLPARRHRSVVGHHTASR